MAIVNKDKMKIFIRSIDENIQVSDDYYIRLDVSVKEMIKRHVERTKLNRRTRILPRDL